MELNKIYLGHNLDIIKTWPDQCVNTIMTSPPYWGLRDYGTEKQIWGGDPECEHDWIPGIKKGISGGISKKNTIKGVEGFQHFKDTKYFFCSKCQAWKGELGQEPNPDLFISHLCDIFDECKRILTIDGSCWVNLGDTHAGNGGNGGQTGIHQSGGKKMPHWKQGKPDVPNKCLIGIPFRFAMEMTRRGWILRNTLIWHKPSCMVSSAKDRMTVDFEYVFFFVKNNKPLYYVNEKTLKIQRKKPLGTKGIEGEDWYLKVEKNYINNKTKRKQPQKPLIMKGWMEKITKRKQTYWNSYDYYFKQQFEPLKQSTIKRSEYNWSKPNSKSSGHQQTSGLNRNGSFKDALNPMGRNKRTVWTINTAKETEAHFAVYPEELVFTPLDSSCPPKICTQCGLPQIYTVVRGHPGGTSGHGKNLTSGINGTVPSISSEILKTTWVKCKCGALFEKGVIFDPFMGSGTTLRVALKHGRNGVGTEINPEYLKIAMKKLKPFLGKKLEDFYK